MADKFIDHGKEVIIIEKSKEYIQCPKCAFTIIPKRYENKKGDEYKFGHFCPKCYVSLNIKREL